MTSAEIAEAVGWAQAVVRATYPRPEVETQLARCVLALVERCEQLEKVYGAAARLRTFPVPYDDHSDLVGIVDDFRNWEERDDA